MFNFFIVFTLWLALCLTGVNYSSPIADSLKVMSGYKYDKYQSWEFAAREFKKGNCLALSDILQDELWSRGVDSRVIIGLLNNSHHAWIETRDGFYLESTTASYVMHSERYTPEIIGIWRSEDK